MDVLYKILIGLFFILIVICIGSIIFYGLSIIIRVFFPWVRKQPVGIKAALITGLITIIITMLGLMKDVLFPPEIKFVNQDNETNGKILLSATIDSRLCDWIIKSTSVYDSIIVTPIDKQANHPPVFLFTIENNLNNQVIIKYIELSIEKISGKSIALRRYEVVDAIAIYSMEYSPYAKNKKYNLLPPLRIERGNTISFQLRLLPYHLGSVARRYGGGDYPEGAYKIRLYYSNTEFLETETIYFKNS